MFKEIPKKISSKQNPLVKHLVKLREKKAYREEHQSVLICSKNLIEEIAQTHTPNLILHLEGEEPTFTCPHTSAPKSLLQYISGLQTTDDWIAVFPYPKTTSLNQKKKIIAIDQISDPGNLGTLIRTALALGWEGLYLLPNSVDPFNEKVIRASRGALFRLPWDYIDYETLRSQSLPLVIADTAGSSPEAIDTQQGLILVLSHEAHGPSIQGERVSIPMPGAMESLNVAIAGGILMYAL